MFLRTLVGFKSSIGFKYSKSIKCTLQKNSCSNFDWFIDLFVCLYACVWMLCCYFFFFSFSFCIHLIRDFHLLQVNFISHFPFWMWFVYHSAEDGLPLCTFIWWTKMCILLMPLKWHWWQLFHLWKQFFYQWLLYFN